MPRAPLFSKLRVRHPKDRVVPNLLCFSRNAFFPLGVRFSWYATVHIWAADRQAREATSDVTKSLLSKKSAVPRCNATMESKRRMPRIDIACLALLLNHCCLETPKKSFFYII